MSRLHIAHLQSDIKQYEATLQDGVDRKGGQKSKRWTEKEDRKHAMPLSLSFLAIRILLPPKCLSRLESTEVHFQSISSVCRKTVSSVV